MFDYRPALALLLVAVPAQATEYSHISEDNLAYCDLYAKRAASKVTTMVQAYGDCIRILPTRLPMPEPQGTVPATDKPVKNDSEEWREQCRKEYGSWDEATGTVIRRGSPDRVRCPCGDEVQCGE